MKRKLVYGNRRTRKLEGLAAALVTFDEELMIWRSLSKN